MTHGDLQLLNGSGVLPSSGSSSMRRNISFDNNLNFHITNMLS